jgi:Domain of unknown function (DUF4262)
VQYVEIDRAPYAYTVGLHDRGLPELLVTGLVPSWAGRLLNCIARDLVKGHVLRPGEHIAHGADPIIEIVEVEHPDVHMGWAIAFGGPDVRALQLVWADDYGRWPWDPEFDDGRRRQPVLGCRQNA